jgi:hypothetical protein
MLMRRISGRKAQLEALPEVSEAGLADPVVVVRGGESGMELV